MKIVPMLLVSTSLLLGCQVSPDRKNDVFVMILESAEKAIDSAIEREFSSEEKKNDDVAKVRDVSDQTESQEDYSETDSEIDTETDTDTDTETSISDIAKITMGVKAKRIKNAPVFKRPLQ